MKAYKYKPSQYRNGVRWNESRKYSKKVEYLFHYTSMYHAFQIICSEILKFSNLPDSNDILESARPTYGLENLHDELNNYRQLSFTMSDNRLGFAIPAMWGHYGDRGRGVCLIFDRNKILSNLPCNSHYSRITYSGDYCKDYDSSIVCNDKADAYILQNMKEIFFTKTEDWSYEQEFRIVCKADSTERHKYIPISSALKGIIIQKPQSISSDDDSAFNTPEYRILNTISPNIPVLWLEKFFNKVSLIDNNGINHLETYRQ